MSDPVTPRLAATLILARDGDAGLELFMVARHRQIEFASGALVFPGGSVDPNDADARLRGRVEGADTAEEAMFPVLVAAAREAFEECGVLFARAAPGGPLVTGERAAELGKTYRKAIEAGEIGLAEMIEKEELVLALDRLVHFAHWVTPPHMPKRFDTHFFLAEAPLDHILRHDGRESVDSIWITPRQVCEDAEADRRTVLFPTRLNVEKVGRSATVADALAAARQAKVVSVRPMSEAAGEGRLLRIPKEADYGSGEFLVVGGSGNGARILNADGSARLIPAAAKRP